MSSLTILQLASGRVCYAKGRFWIGYDIKAGTTGRVEEGVQVLEPGELTKAELQIL